MTPETVAQALAAHHLWAVAGTAALAWLALLGVLRLLRHTRLGRGGGALLLVLGLLAWATLAMLALAAVQAPASAWLLRLDLALLQALPAQLSPTALRAWSLVTHAGDAQLLTLLAAAVALLLAWRRQHGLLALWLLTLAGNGLLIRATKATVERLRPLHGHDWPVVISGSSFPSGHAGAATVVWGLGAWLLARWLPPRWHGTALLAAVLLVVAVGWSRVLLQVHHASDVLAGWLGGLVWLGLCLAAFSAWAGWARRRGAAAG